MERAQNSAKATTRQAVHQLEKLAHGKKKAQTGKEGSPADADKTTSDTRTEQAGPPDSAKPVQIKTKDAVQRSASAEYSHADPAKFEPSQIKTKDACIRRQTTVPTHEHAETNTVPSEPQTPHSTQQGRQKFVREQRKKAAEQRMEKQREPERTASVARQRSTIDTQSRHTPTLSAQDKKQPAGKAAQETVSKSKRRVKEARSGVSAVGRTSRQAVKGADSSGKILQAGGRSTQTMRQAARSAVQARQRAVQAAGAAKRTAATAGRPVAKAAALALRKAVSGLRALAVPLAAGGGAVVAVVLVICLVGAVLLSPLGIFFSFFSGGSSGGGSDSEQPTISISDVVQEINQEYDARLEEIKSGVTYDEVSMSGSRASWVEILAVYSVKTASDPTDGQEVVTMNDEKKGLLKQVFWDMNELSSYTSTVQGEGDGAESTTTLYITVTHKTADEMADVYNFTEDQRQQLDEMLSEENREMWNTMLSGAGSGSGEIVGVALSQVGNVGGEPYWSWYGFTYRVDWCAIFVSWCANECGYIDAGVIPRFSGCVQGSGWFKNRGLWQDKSYTPNPGDIIFFDWDDPGGYSGPQDGVPDHVGIVEKVENGRVYTIEGNSGDKCCQRSYPVGYYEIYGYGIICL